jgi:hypothetical protein
MLPRDLYISREAECRARARGLERREAWISGGRLGSVVVAIGLAIAAIKGIVSVWTLVAPALSFAILVVVHERAVRRRRRHETLRDLYRAGIARTDDTWPGQGDPGERFQAEATSHLYAADLDIYGRGGLFELLNVARTPIGQRTLARWLEAPAAGSVARARQLAVAELTPRLDLREELALAGGAVTTEVREEALSVWAATPASASDLPVRLGPTRLLLAGLALGTAASLVLWPMGRLAVWPAIAAAAVTWLAARRWRAGVLVLIGGVDKRSAELRLLVHAMACLEREKFQAPLLRELQGSLSVEGERPSQRVARLRRLVDWLDARRNQFMALLLAPLQWTTQLTLAIEAWRRVDGPAVGRWMEAVGTLDALIALATFAFEHPEYPFPQIRDATDDGSIALPIFEAQGLGHPLLPADRRVVNDVALGGERRLMIVSGSNMSGKSTLLRSVGTNAVLALAGAPVCARSLTLSPVQAGATLRINDSLQEGKSRFYAELTRLKQIVDRASAEPPLLFLLDEILHGTNSHDRRIGAEAVLRGLVARGAIGLVTTHDLALTEVADALAPRAVNVHFEDHLEDGVMTFDYQMKPGVVRKSNALALMRAVGLDVTL